MMITIRIGIDEKGIKIVDKMGIDKMGSHRFEVCYRIWRDIRCNIVSDNVFVPY